MHELIPTTTSIIGHEEANTVNGRELHRFLRVGRDFPTWIKDRLFDYKENQDYIVFTEKVGNPSGGRPRKEYHLTLDMAKELSMMERNDMGKIARDYFIKCEKKANNIRFVLNELMNSRPLWRKIERYTELGLSMAEVALLCKRTKSTIRGHVRRMEACGLLTPPPNLKELQAMAQRLLPGMEA